MNRKTKFNQLMPVASVCILFFLGFHGNSKSQMGHKSNGFESEFKAPVNMPIKAQKGINGFSSNFCAFVFGMLLKHVPNLGIIYDVWTGLYIWSLPEKLDEKTGLLSLLHVHTSQHDYEQISVVS